MAAQVRATRAKGLLTLGIGGVKGAEVKALAWYDFERADGKYLLYFAAKYGRVNPVEARIRELVNAQVGEFDWFAYTR